jgi:hypothetical protein
VLHSFVLGGNEALGFADVACAKALAFFGVGIETIIGIAVSAID